MRTQWRIGDPEPDVVGVEDRFSRTWEPMREGLGASLWRHAGEALAWRNLLAEHGPVTEVTR